MAMLDASGVTGCDTR